MPGGKQRLKKEPRLHQVSQPDPQVEEEDLNLRPRLDAFGHAQGEVIDLNLLTRSLCPLLGEVKVLQTQHDDDEELACSKWFLVALAESVLVDGTSDNLYFPVHIIYCTFFLIFMLTTQVAIARRASKRMNMSRILFVLLSDQARSLHLMHLFAPCWEIIWRGRRLFPKTVKKTISQKSRTVKKYIYLLRGFEKSVKKGIQGPQTNVI